MATRKMSRNFHGVVYPDSDSYDCSDVLSRLAQFSDFAYILHDQDMDENGELKKPHYHWLVARDTPAPLSTMVNALGVPENSVEFCRSYRAFLRYMIHADEPTKHQYSPDDVKGVFKKHFLLGSSEKSFVLLAMEKISSGDIRSIQGLAAFGAELEDWPSFRRNYSLLKDLLYEQLSNEEVKQGGWVNSARDAETIPLDNSGALPGESCR